jgi:hypothetical protein
MDTGHRTSAIFEHWYLFVKYSWYVLLQGPSWSYGSWIYNYLYATMPITTKVVSSNATHDEMYSIQHYVIKFVSDLWQVAVFLHQYDWPPRYSWNIVESGVKHHNPHNLSIVYCIREIQIGFSLYKLFIGKFCAKYRYRCISIYIIPQVHLLVQLICSLYQYSSRNIYVQYAFEENLLLIWTFFLFSCDLIEYYRQYQQTFSDDDEYYQLVM